MAARERERGREDGWAQGTEVECILKHQPDNEVSVRGVSHTGLG